MQAADVPPMRGGIKAGLFAARLKSCPSQVIAAFNRETGIE
jgi:hypothetical protein